LDSACSDWEPPRDSVQVHDAVTSDAERDRVSRPAEFGHRRSVLDHLV